MARKNIEDERRYHREYMREQRAFFIAHGLCSECGREDAFTMAGRRRCAECAEKKNARSKSDEAKARCNERAKKLRMERRERKECTKCGKPLPKVAYPYVMCEGCRARDRARQEAKNRAGGTMPRGWFAEAGLCIRCGAPRMEGVTAWGGEPVKLCGRCYADTVSAGEAGRIAYQEKHGSTYGEDKYAYERKLRRGKERARP